MENIFVISFYHVAKPMSRAENMIKTQNKTGGLFTETSRQLT